MRIASIAITLFSCALCAQVATAAAADQGTPAHQTSGLAHSLLAGAWTRARSPADAGRRDALLAGLGIPSNGFSQAQGQPLITVDTPPPLKAQYLQKWQAFIKAAYEADVRGKPFANPYVHCLPDGMPSMMMGMFPMAVLQAPDRIAIVEEAFRQIRYIYLDQKQITPITDAEPGFWGHSVGHWEGDTLMVNTIGIKESVRLEAVPHSDQMQIDEQIKLLSPDRFQDSLTVSDPVYLTRPWSFTWVYKRDPGYQIAEYVCEDNREDASGNQQQLKLFQGPGQQ